MINRRGYIATISGDNSTYELDNLKPTPGSGITELLPDKLVDSFDHQKLEFPEVSISIWGDSYGRKLKLKHRILTFEYDDHSQVLSIFFKDYCQLRIKKPSIIHHSSSYLKIIKAEEILWRVPNADRMDEYYYLNEGKNIKTKSNTNWQPKSEDLGPGMNALYLQG